MGMPNIPNITPIIAITTEQTIPLLLSSIALEELALAHIMNAEGEKLQFTLETQPTIEELITVNREVRRMLQAVIKKEILLQFKFENVLELIEAITPPDTEP